MLPPPVLHVVKPRPQAQSALGGAKRRFRLRELDIPAPQLRRIGFLTVGAEQIRAFLAVRFLARVHGARDLEVNRAAGRVALDGGLDNRRGGGKLAQRPADPPAHRFLVGLRCAAQPRRDLPERRAQALALTLEHGAFFFRARGAAAEDVSFARRSALVRDKAHFQPRLRLLPVGLFQQLRFVLAQPALRRADEVARLAFTQKRDVRLADHAAGHDPDAFGHAVGCFQGRDDRLDRRHIGAVARKRLEGQRQALGRADHADADLFAIAAAVARMASLGLRIELRLAFQVGSPHIVEQKLETHVESLAVTCHRVCAQRILAGAELVEGAGEPRVVDQACVDAERIVEVVRGAYPCSATPSSERCTQKRATVSSAATCDHTTDSRPAGRSAA